MIEAKSTIRIQDLTISEPEVSPIAFADPRKLFSPADWDGLGVRVEAFLGISTDSEGERWHEIDQDFLLQVALLDPEIIRSRFRMSDYVWERYVDDIPPDMEGEKLTQALATLKVIEPQKFKDENILTPERWDKIVFDFREHNFNTGFAFLNVGHMRIIDPEKADQLYIGQEGWNEINTSIEGWKTQRRWGPIADLAVDAKLAFPSQMDKLNLNTRDWRAMWDFMTEEFEKNKDGNPGGDCEDFLKVSYNMAILASKEIKVTDTGVKMIYGAQSQFKNHLKPVPDRRKF